MKSIDCVASPSLSYSFASASSAGTLFSSRSTMFLYASIARSLSSTSSA